MKRFAILIFLATSGFMAEAKLDGIRPRKIVVSGTTKYTIEEWNIITEAQKQSPGHFPGFKNGTGSQQNFTEPDHRITRGTTASRAQFPWQVALTIDLSYFCGGSLISEEWVLTAAHCVGFIYAIVLGSNRYDIPLQSGSMLLVSSTSYRHEQYDSEWIDNDIAVIKLPQLVGFTVYLYSVRLPTRAQAGYTFVDETVRCSGWGRISDQDNNLASSLQYADMKVITNSACAETFTTYINDTKICVSTPDFKSPCNGDSGGPLVIQEDDGRYTEIGIVSFGHSSGCEKGYPAAFTRITSYLDWIEANTNIVIG